MDKNEAKKQAREFKTILNAANDSERVAIIDELCREMCISHFRKDLTKYKVEAVLCMKKPRVNKTTRESYKNFCVTAAICAKSENNSPLVKRINTFSAGL